LPDTIDDAYASLYATLPGIDSRRRPPNPQGPLQRRYKAPEERRAVRQMVVRPRTLAPEPADALGPCSGCRHMARCSAEVIACDAFLLFVKLGDESSAERLKFAPRFPGRAIQERMLTSPRRVNRS
jgi:hypothetical protein